MKHLPLKGKFFFSLLAFVVLCIGSAFTAKADPITITTGNPGNQGTDNVLFNDANLSHSGTLVQGNFNGAGNGFVVDFTSSSGSHLLNGGGGQATLTGGAGNTPFTQTTFCLENNATFTKAIFNIDVTNGLQPPTTVQFMVTYIGAGGGVFTQTFVVNTNGQNFFSVEAAMGARILCIGIQATGNTTFADLNQVRLGGFAPNAPVPEPVSMLLFGTGLVGVAAKIRKRRKGVMKDE